MKHNPYYGIREQVEAGEISPPFHSHCRYACRYPEPEDTKVLEVLQMLQRRLEVRVDV